MLQSLMKKLRRKVLDMLLPFVNALDEDMWDLKERVSVLESEVSEMRRENVYRQD